MAKATNTNQAAASPAIDLAALTPTVSEAPVKNRSQSGPAPWETSPAPGWVQTARDTGKTVEVGPIPAELQAKVLSYVRKAAAAVELGVRAEWAGDTLRFATKQITRRPRKPKSDDTASAE